MGMAFDQPRHQRHAARLDHLGARPIQLTPGARHGADARAFDQHVGGKRSAAAAVPNPAIADDGAAHAIPNRLERYSGQLGTADLL
jgi:hypothetical protein